MNTSRTKSPEALRKSISAFLKKLGIEKKVRQAEIIVRWAELVGDNVASATEPQPIVEKHDDILHVKVKNSSWRHEMMYLKGHIFSKIETEIGKGIIKDIRFD